jgi:cation-transporting ATPase 13A1
MQQSVGDTDTGGNLPNTPDGGCLCYVLQTGFSSTQVGQDRLILSNPR